MMRPHCDLCNAVIDEGFVKWVEVEDWKGIERIWHISLGPDDPDFCKTCWTVLLTKNITELQRPLVDDDIPF